MSAETTFTARVQPRSGWLDGQVRRFFNTPKEGRKHEVVNTHAVHAAKQVHGSRTGKQTVALGAVVAMAAVPFHSSNVKDQAPGFARLPASACSARKCVECGDILKPNYPNPICSQCERKQNTQNYDN